MGGSGRRGGVRMDGIPHSRRRIRNRSSNLPLPGSNTALAADVSKRGTSGERATCLVLFRRSVRWKGRRGEIFCSVWAFIISQ